MCYVGLIYIGFRVQIPLRTDDLEFVGVEDVKS